MAGSVGQLLRSGGAALPTWSPVTVNSAGAVNIPAPSSGASLTVNGIAPTASTTVPLPVFGATDGQTCITWGITGSMNSAFSANSTSGLSNWSFGSYNNGTNWIATMASSMRLSLYNTTGASYPQALFVTGLSAGNTFNWTGAQAFAMPAVSYVTSQESGHANTTANDTYLTFSIPAAGAFKIKCVLIMYASAASADLNLNINYSGSYTANNSWWSCMLATALGTLPTNPIQITSSASASWTSASAMATSASSPNMVILEGILLATAGGTLSLAWGTNTSNGAYMQAGSCMEVVQM